MNVKEIEDYRKMIAHHCQRVMVDVFKVLDKTDLYHQRPEDAYSFLSRYRIEVRTKLDRYVKDQWWGRAQ